MTRGGGSRGGTEGRNGSSRKARHGGQAESPDGHRRARDGQRHREVGVAARRGGADPASRAGRVSFLPRRAFLVREPRWKNEVRGVRRRNSAGAEGRGG